ncbi:MAG: hypothetical protein M3Y58_23620 [Chloroflexota bacterium]|nr:hypothetical protein [Chloroflexota bacterium]
MTERTARERHDRDLFNAILGRLRALDNRETSMPEIRKEVSRIADLIRTHLDREEERL